MSTFAIQTPFRDKKAVELSRNLFRKQVLPKRSIDYEGRKITFDEAYMTELAASFRDGAFDQVAFLMAPSDNSHTMDPERFRGEVKGFELTADGLDAILELSDAGAQVVRDNPKLGVSARIVESFKRADGKTFGRAIQHVLGTLDPRVNDLKPWEAIALSNSDLEVIDLTSSVYEKKGATMPAEPKKPAPISDEQRAAFDAYLTELAALDTTKVVDPTKQTPAPTGDDALDAELEALLADALATEGAGGAELSADTRQAIELANARIAETQNQNAAIRAELDLSNFEREKAALLASGIPPVMVDLAMPLLLGKDHVIELSNSTKVDAGDIVRKLLDESKGIVDLSKETTPAPGSPAADKTGELLDRWEKQFPALAN